MRIQTLSNYSCSRVFTSVTVLLLALSQALAVSIDQSFTYDALNRLTASSGGTYVYDAAGNLLTITGPPPTKPSGPTPGSGTNGIGRLPTLGWTAAQNATGLTLYFSTNSNLSGATQVVPSEGCLIQS